MRAMERGAFAVACFQFMRWTARFAGYRHDVPRRRSGDDAIRPSGRALAPRVEWNCLPPKRC